VKLPVIFISVLLMICFCMASEICVAQQAESPARDDTSQTTQTEGPRTEPNTPTDSNSTKAISKYKGLTEAVEELESDNRTEVREWMQGEMERKLRLMDAVHKRRKAEYELLRKVAAEEKAEKTLAVIDELIEKCDARYERISTKLRDDQRSARLQALRERKEQAREERRRRREERRSNFEGRGRRRSTRDDAD